MVDLIIVLLHFNCWRYYLMMGDRFKLDKSTVPFNLSSMNEVKFALPIKLFNGSIVNTDPCA